MLASLSILRPRAAAGAFLALLVALQLGPAQAQSPAAAPALPAAGSAPVAPPPPNHLLHMMRGHQVWRDELPARLDAAAVEIVILSPDSRCNPPVVTLMFGLKTSTLHPDAARFCRRIASFVQAPPAALPTAVRVHTGELGSRQPQAVLAAISPAPTRRYVALVYWDWMQANRDFHWMFEVAVLDRSDGRWVWHGARNNQSTVLSEWRDRYELVAVQALLQHELPRDLLDAAWWQRALPVPDSRWVALADMADYKPAAGRAGLVVTNSYYSASRLVDNAPLKLWPAGTPEIDDTQAVRQGDWSQGSTRTRAQSTPPLAPDTYLLLDLPAGEYNWRLGDGVQSMTLAEGQITVMNMWRRLGNSWGLGPETEAWWRDRVQRSRSRHAFFAEPPDRGWAAVVPYFVNTVP